MAIIDNVIVRWDLSPRLIVIPIPITEVTVQSLHDTLKEIESRPGNMIYPILITTTGKEDLGGGVSVGLTATLQNAQVSFEARYPRTSIGVSTTAASSDGILLTDTGATFISDGVIRGATITNFDEQAYATVVDIISETVIRHDPLQDGINNDWEIGDTYKVHNEIQCEVTGGNLVAVDDLIVSIDPISPTAFVQIVRTSASSSTNQNSLDIEYASFGGGVSVDINNFTGLSSSGTNFPAGTPRQPCNNFEDALEILNTRGFTILFIGAGTTLIDSGLTYIGITFIGSSKTKSNFEISSDAITIGCEFEDATITGTLDGYSVLKNSLLDDINFVDGFVEDCVLRGTIILSGLNQASFLHCSSAIAGSNSPTIDMGGSGSNLILRDYNGGIKLINKSGIENVSIDMNSGHVNLDSTITNGTLTIRGIGKLTDNSGVGAIVQAIDLIEGIKIQRLAYESSIHINSQIGIAGITAGVNGLPSNPSNNIQDSFILADTLGLNSFNILASLSLDRDISNWKIKSDGLGFLTFDGYSADSSTFSNMILSGEIGVGSSSAVSSLITDNCDLINITQFKGVCSNIQLAGTVSLNPNVATLISNLATDERSLPFSIPLSMTESIIISEPPTLDVNGGEITIQGLDGYLIVDNVNVSSSLCVISMNSAEVFISPSCTDGDIIIRGTGNVTNAGSSNLNISGNLNVNEISSDIFNKLFPFTAGAQ